MVALCIVLGALAIVAVRRCVAARRREAVGRRILDEAAKLGSQEGVELDVYGSTPATRSALEATLTERDLPDCEMSGQSWNLFNSNQRQKDLSLGDVVYYDHKEHGLILVKVLKVLQVDSRRGAYNGGVKYTVGAAPQLKGAEIETFRSRLFTKMPDRQSDGSWMGNDGKKQRAKKGAAAVEMSTAIVPVQNSDDEDENEDEDNAAMAAADALLVSIASRAGESGGDGKPPEGDEGDAADTPYEIYGADDASVAVVAQGRAITRGEAVSGKHGPLRKGDQVWYNSRSLGPIPAKIVGIDSRGTFDGGETYLIESPRLDGDAIETVRERLSRVKPLQ